MDRALADPADSKARLAVGVEPAEEIHTHKPVCQLRWWDKSYLMFKWDMILAGFGFLYEKQ